MNYSAFESKMFLLSPTNVSPTSQETGIKTSKYEKVSKVSNNICASRSRKYIRNLLKETR